MGINKMSRSGTKGWCKEFCLVIMIGIGLCTQVDDCDGAMMTKGRGLTIIVHPGQEECFFEHFSNGSILIEYRVTSSTYGDYSINFQLSCPKLRPIITKFKTSGSSIVVKVDKDGVYRLCFDNTVSHLSVKNVLFKVERNRTDLNPEWAAARTANITKATDENILSISAGLDKVKILLDATMKTQDTYMAIQRKGYDVGRINLATINFCVVFVILFQLFILGMEVLMIQSLFWTDMYYRRKDLERQVHSPYLASVNNVNTRSLSRKNKYSVE